MRRCWRVARLLSVAGLLVATAAVAGEPDVVAYPVATHSALVPQSAAGDGHSSLATADQWLQIQANGGMASAHVQQATARERELTYQRLLDSYGHAIPVFFEQRAGGTIEP